MGFTHRELLAGLPSAVAPFRIEKQSDLVYRLVDVEPGRAGQDNAGQGNTDQGDAEQRVMVTLQPQTSRSIAAITLPVTTVKLEFFGFNSARFDRFMRRYKRYLHKGGG